MPFPSYDMSDIVAFAEDDVHYASILKQQKELRQPVTEPLEIAPVVAELEHKHRKAVRLCNEMISTLTLEGNQHLFEGFPQDWAYKVEEWQKRVRALQ